MSKFISSIIGPSLHITMQCWVTVVGLFLGQVCASDCVSLGAHTHTHALTHVHTMFFGLIDLIYICISFDSLVHTRVSYFAGGG